MANDPTLPGWAEPLVPGGGPPTVPWRKFFEKLSRGTDLTADQSAAISALDVRVGELEDAEGDVGTVLGLGSLQVSGSLSDQLVIQLEGDDDNPAASSYYGTDDLGAKGYRLLADGLGDCTTDDLPEGVTNLYFATGIAAFKAAPSLGTLVNAANDAAAAAGGVPVGGLYRNASALMIRVV